MSVDRPPSGRCDAVPFAQDRCGRGRLWRHGRAESGCPCLRLPARSGTRSRSPGSGAPHRGARPAARRPPRPAGLRVAFLVYRGNPRCGGQGVYTRHLTRELVALGHSVEVFAGQPWPELDDGVGLHPGARARPLPRPRPLPGPPPARVPRTRATWLEFGVMCTAGFAEPLGLLARGPAGCWPTGAATSTSSTTTSASATGCSA